MSLKRKATGVTLLLSGTHSPKCSQRLPRTHGILGPGTAPMVLDAFLVLLSLIWRTTLPCSALPCPVLKCSALSFLTCHYLTLPCPANPLPALAAGYFWMDFKSFQAHFSSCYFAKLFPSAKYDYYCTRGIGLLIFAFNHILMILVALTFTKHSYTHSLKHSHTNTHIHLHAHSYTHSLTHTRTLMHTFTHTHTHMHIHSH
jgi:hypothetical protein